MACHKAVAQCDRHVFCQLVAVVDEIEASLKFHQLICLYSRVVLIEIVTDRAVFDDHFAIGGKLIIPRLQRCAVRIRITADKVLLEIHRRVLCQLVGVTDEIEIAVVFHQLIGVQTHIVFIEIITDRTCVRFLHNGHTAVNPRRQRHVSFHCTI